MPKGNREVIHWKFKGRLITSFLLVAAVSGLVGIIGEIGLGSTIAKVIVQLGAMVAAMVLGFFLAKGLCEPVDQMAEQFAEARTKVNYLNMIPTPVMAVDKNYNIRFMNQAGAQAVGRTPEACTGQKCFSLFNTHHCNTSECRIGRAMREGGNFTGETIAKLPGGELPIRYTATPILDAAGNIVGGLEYVMDISETKHALDEAQAKIQYLDRIPTPVMAVDKDFNIHFMNTAGARAVGMTPENCMGQKCFNLFNTLHCNTAECRVAKAVREDGVFTGNTVAKLPSGELPIRYSAAPLKDANGTIIGGLEYVVEISEEYQAVAEVRNLSQEAVKGNLSARANPAKYSIAGFRDVVQGINETLDAIIEPIKEASAVLEEMSEGNLRVKVTGDYEGDHATIKNALNEFLIGLVR